MFDIPHMEALRNIIKASGQTHEAWAGRFGCSRQHLTEIVNGTAHPSKKLIVRIADATGGAIAPGDWFAASTEKPQ